MPRDSVRPALGRALRLTAWVLAPAVAACSSDAVPLRLSVQEVESPAGEGSGEPYLSSAGDTVYLTWLEGVPGGRHELRIARLEASPPAGSWGKTLTVAAGESFFVNWADFPSITPGPDGALWVHWLEHGPEGGYDYGIRIVRSSDGGETWSEPWTPHEDGTPTEHGFVSTVAVDGALGFLWLDGRSFVPAAAGATPAMEMALYFRLAEGGRAAGPETLVDGRVCDCCQTDMALTSRGPIAVYRDRSAHEIRDIRIARMRDGAWVQGSVVHEDGWETAACPVNGPAVVARGEDVAVAWFTAAGGVPHVKVAFSRDAGGRFGAPLVVDMGNPAGRVDLVMLADGSALVSWLERSGGERAEVLARRVERGGHMSEPVSVSVSSGERASGFPRLATTETGSVYVAWTDVAEIRPRVRVARIDLEQVME